MAPRVAVAELPALRVSYSEISAYLRCPRSHAYRYIQRAPPAFRPSVLSFGSAVHEALAAFYSVIRDGLPEPTSQDLQDVFAKAWDMELSNPLPILFNEKDNAEALLETGKALLSHFHSNAPRPHRVLAVEAPFSVEIFDPATGEVWPERLAGYFDAVTQDENGKIHILEHKTAARKWADDRLANDLQITAYHFAAQELGFANAQVDIQVLLKTKQPALTIYKPARTTRDHLDFLSVASGCLKAINAGADHPIRDWHCKSCPYSSSCIAG